MKLLKNIIRLFVLTSISLSMTPLTTANAATTPIKVSNETDSLNITYNTPVAEATSVDTADTTTDNDTTTTDAGDPAYSNVSVTVLSGILTLQAVPDFNFGSMMIGSTTNLKSNTVDYDKDSTGSATNSTFASDGNTSGLLTVIDLRNDLKEMPGFSLTASMGKLQSSDALSSLNAILTLNSIPLLNDQKENVSNSETPLTTDKAVLDSTKSDQVPVMNLQAGTYTGGMISAAFNTSDSASMEIPKGQNSVTSGTQVKNMNSIVTWTLSTKPVVK